MKILQKTLCFSLFLSSLFAIESFTYYGFYPQEAKLEHLYRPPKPLMWCARLKVDRAYFFGNEMNIYKLGEFFHLVYGVSVGYLEKHLDGIHKNLVLSTYLGMRFDLQFTKKLHAIFFYSPAGPSALMNKEFATTRYSNNFVFTDQIGIGLKFDRRHPIEIGARMYHFSNADIFPINGGIDVPIMFYIGIYG